MPEAGSQPTRTGEAVLDIQVCLEVANTDYDYLMFLGFCSCLKMQWCFLRYFIGDIYDSEYYYAFYILSLSKSHLR